MSSRGNPTDLTSIQRWMQSVITHPDGVEAGIEAPASRELIDVATAQIERVICRSEAQSSIERLNVYANAYYARLLEVLTSEYPALVHALGEELFQGFAFGYLQEHPSHSYTLSDLSALFPTYLARTRPEREREDDSPDWADFLVDLSTLERTYGEVFDGPGVEGEPLLDAGRQARIPPERWPHMRLTPIPCLRLLSLRFPLHQYVSAVRRKEQPELPAPATTHLVITRRDYIVRRVAVDAVEFVALTALVNGATVIESLQLAQTHWSGSMEAMTLEVQRWFRDWTAAGYFQDVIDSSAVPIGDSACG